MGSACLLRHASRVFDIRRILNLAKVPCLLVPVPMQAQQVPQQMPQQPEKGDRRHVQAHECHSSQHRSKA